MIVPLSVAEVVPPYLEYNDPEVRAAAVSALKNLPTGSADNLIAYQLQQDPEPSVRDAALTAMAARPLTTEGLSVLLVMVEAERNDALRHRAVLVLAGVKSMDPQIATVLQWVAENDKNEKIRNAAANALAA